MSPRPRIIVHMDADAFFASVEQAADTHLRGKPIAVGGEKRGIIASASYEARRFGVKTPMPTAQARKLCPKLIVLPGNYERYEDFSRWMFSYPYDFTPYVEQTSIDEGYFDLTASPKSPEEVAQTVRKAIRQRLKITVSEGVASNKLVSQIASKLNKPYAFQQIPRGEEARFLAPLDNKWLPGIGPKTAARLNSAGLARIRQIAETPVDLLELVLGKQAVTVRQHAHGIDERPLIPVSEPQKTFSEQQTFGQDVTDETFLAATLRRMADDLFAKVRGDNRSIRTLTVRVRYNDMSEDQVSESLLEPTDLETDIYTRLNAMLKAAWKRRISVRLVSLKLSNLYNGQFRTELALDRKAEQGEARSRLARVVDELRQTKGRLVIVRGHDFTLRAPPVDASKPIAPPAVRKPIIRKQTAYVPLRMHSYYSFLDSLLSPTAIVQLAQKNQCPAVALTDTGNLHGVVEFVQAAQNAGIKPIIGVELRYGDHPLLLYVQNATGYENLCRLLSQQAIRADDESVASKQMAPVAMSLLVRHAAGLLAVSSETSLREVFGDRFYPAGKPGNILCAPVHYARPEDRRCFDIVQSIRTLTLVNQAHPLKRAGGKYHFRTAAELPPAGLPPTLELAERCNFDFPFGKPQFPAYHPPDGSTSRAFLLRMALDGLRRRYQGKAVKSDTGAVVPVSHLRAQLETELSIITEVGYEDLFLLTWDLLQDCRRRGIEWITRGSAADSLVCYCLGISDVCPIRFGLYFRRFLNKDRMALNKLPDIDVDFPHDRKDDVVNMLLEKYGPEHSAVVGGFSTFKAKSAVADVAKVLGVSEFQIRRFTEHFPWSFGGGWVSEDHHSIRGAALLDLLRASPECRDLPIDQEPFKTAVETAAFLDGFPRHPKMHPCGVVVSRQPMTQLTPTFISNKGWPTTHMDMESVEAVGLVKMDVLAQGGLAVMRDAVQTLKERGIAVDLAALEPWEDPEVWELIASGGARAVHHIESPAMVSLCRMTNVREIDGLIAIVSVIRPGAANENKKRDFTRRYQGMEPPYYPHPSLEDCLRSTYGLVVYEEHILQICEAFAGMPPGRADVLRRALVKQKRKVVDEIGEEFANHALAKGHNPKKILEVWELVTGFNGYAFCKAHSTAYGVEAYQAAWLKRYYPAEFMAGVLTNGKGFYHPLVYVLECHRIGLKLIPPSINHPGPHFAAENGTIRVPVTAVKGLTEKVSERLLTERKKKPFTALKDFYLRVLPSAEEMEAMMRVGAFDEFGQTRTHQFWEVQSLHRSYGNSAEPGQGWLLPPPSLDKLPMKALQEPNTLERLQRENELLGYTASAHPLALYPAIAWDTYCPVSRLKDFIGQEVIMCGLIIEQRTHHQITGEPMKFMTLCDWTGIVETELFANTYRSYGLATVRYPVLEVTVKVEAYENKRGYSLCVLRAGKPRRSMR
jgi:DNA polymerase-3 subunit alpha